MVSSVREVSLISYGLLCRKEATAMGYNAVLHTMVTSILTHGPNIMILLSVTVYTLTQQAFSEEDVSNHSLIISSKLKQIQQSALEIYLYKASIYKRALSVGLSSRS